ncbi:hypothetical protein MHM582_1494 [Microbacterium sp. HM58-2]|nr:hypothetical protein MHM582_1494 [Microbacterium sp. HM58-2]
MSDDREMNGDAEKPAEPVESDVRDTESRSSDGPPWEQLTGFRVPTRFTESLFPSFGVSAAEILAPVNERLQEQLSSLVSPLTERMLDDVGSLVSPLSERMLDDVSSLISPLSERMLDHVNLALPATNLLGTTSFDILPLNLLSSAATGILEGLGEQFAKTLEGLQASIGPLIDPAVLQGIKLSFLPPNLHDVGDEISFSDVHAFIQQEGIPLYLVPRARTAVRLLRAPDRPSRRRILGECFGTLMDDCEAVLANITHPALREEVAFALDGLGAMRSGHTRSAQAMFTVTLDTLIYAFYPDRNERRALTNRKKDAEVPESFDEMSVHEAMVWLPIWNAHEQFWKDKGDQIPRYYSRHASVHGVSSRQFNKRNCVQVLMLVTSLIGYAESIL